ncbi:GNAT family N-acetyltransferase [Desulfonatronum thiodismutans]|uniref:GNAT family N-acetyltransferase n=1 Tax=Desulfonatronum thiodismutans TaxID=159290 RepID=UPI0004ABEB8B|nr:GNAT family N-acetyltransferase [Desulfonatronum thiodismutans]
MICSPPAPLSKAHLLGDFDCGKPLLNTWLTRYALQAQGSGSAKTYVVCHAFRVVGYFSMTVGQVETHEAPERIRHGMGRYPIPVVILARLAVDLGWQDRGLGVGMLQDAIRRTFFIAEQAGIRALLTHPMDENAESFYRRFGFISSPVCERQLLLLLKDARKFVQTNQAD